MSLPEGENITAFIAQWFEERGVDLFCPACGQKRWQPTQYTATPWIHGSGHFAESEGQVVHYHLLPLYCRNCGYMVFFNAGHILNSLQPGSLPSYLPDPVIEVGRDESTDHKGPAGECPELLM